MRAALWVCYDSPGILGRQRQLDGVKSLQPKRSYGNPVAYRLRYGNNRLKLKMPDTAVPTLKKPEFLPLIVGPRTPGMPVFPMPEVTPLCPVPPLAVLKKPDIRPGVPPPVAVLKNPELRVPVLLKPELVRPVSVVDPKPVLTLPEFPLPVLKLPEFPLPVLKLPESQKPVLRSPELLKPVFAEPPFPKPVLSWPLFPKPVLPAPEFPIPRLPLPELPKPKLFR